MATAISPARAGVDDLYRAPGKAELVHGELQLMPPTGAMPGRAAGAIFVSLRLHALETGVGEAVGDSVGFLVDLPHRQSFCPDVAFWTGPDPGMKFYEGEPVFAVEVRSEFDSGPAAERNMAAKRADYFAAGTAVVWDVDLQAIDAIRVFTSKSSASPVRCFERGDVADAEPAIPGWRFPVDHLYGA